MRINLAAAALVAVGSACTPAEKVDEPASSLTVKASIIDLDETPPDGKMPVVVQFLRGTELVELIAGATVTCNGVPLSFNGLGYAERVPVVAAGGKVTVVHARDGRSTQLEVTVPARPTIISPTLNEQVFRSQVFEIGFTPGGGAGVRAGASGTAGGRSGTTEPDDGTATVDASGVGTGAGTVSIARDFEGLVQGTGFAAATFTYTTGKSIAVSWQ